MTRIRFEPVAYIPAGMLKLWGYFIPPQFYSELTLSFLFLIKKLVSKKDHNTKMFYNKTIKKKIFNDANVHFDNLVQKFI